MAYFSTATAPERRNPTGKNRVWDFFRLSNETHPATHRQPLQPRRKIRPTATKTASGIPYWPSRDPIGEDGGVNLYGFAGNDGVYGWDILGLNYVLYNGVWRATHPSAPSRILDVERINTDVNTLQLEEGDMTEAPNAMALATGLKDWRVTTEVSQSFLTWVGLADKATLSIHAKAPQIQLIRAHSTDPNAKQKVRDPNAAINPRKGEAERTVLQHERDHAAQIKGIWNMMIDEIEPYDGAYCPVQCAYLAQRIVAATSAYYQALARRDGEEYDVAAYGGHTMPFGIGPAIKLRNQILNDEKARLDQASKDFNDAKCTKP